MTGSILQISISPGGIPKRAIAEAAVTREGLRGDAWAHPEFHGGPNQAILLITSEGIDELRAQGFALFPGALGENLTTLGLDRHMIRIGQRFRAGGALIEISKIRSPCATLEMYWPEIRGAVYDDQVKAKDPASARWGLGGFYARVLYGGTIRTHDIIELVDQVV